MKPKTLTEIAALIIGISFTLFVISNLIGDYGLNFYFTEPNPFIRIPEIIVGLLAIPVLCLMIFKRLKGGK